LGRLALSAVLPANQFNQLLEEEKTMLNENFYRLERKRTTAKLAALLLGIALILAGLAMIVGRFPVEMTFLDIIPALLVIAGGYFLIYLRKRLYEDSLLKCPQCNRVMVLPFWDAHVWCSIWNFPLMTITAFMCRFGAWSFRIVGWFKPSEWFEKSRNKIRMNIQYKTEFPTSGWVVCVIIQRLLIAGPLMIIIIGNYLLPPSFWWVTMLLLSHSALLVLVFFKSYRELSLGEYEFSQTVFIMAWIFFIIIFITPMKYYAYLYVSA
jgi:hypothetical protein